MSEFGRTVCVPHKDITTIARDVYYGIKILKSIGEKAKAPVPPP